MTSEDRQLIDVVMGMFHELSDDLRMLRTENKGDHINQQAATAALDKKVSEALRRQDQHDKWHGKNDAEIARRLRGIEAGDHDGHVAEQAVAAYKAGWSWLAEIGTDARKVITVGIASSLLVVIGYIVGHI